MLKVALLGFGGIAQAAHRPAYASLLKKGKARLVAACDIVPERFHQKMEINLGAASDDGVLDFNTYTDLEEMLAHESIDLIDICLPTFLHAQKAAQLLRRGYHVLSEKPMGAYV